jgi:hypothetical protein
MESIGETKDIPLFSVWQYLEQAITGTFLGIYNHRSQVEEVDAIFKQIEQKPPQPQALQDWYKELACNYINGGYKDLIRGTPSYTGGKLGCLASHSPQCVMLSLGRLVIFFSDKLDWSRIRVGTKAAFDTSLCEQVHPKLRAIMPVLKQQFDHPCAGPKPSELNVNEELWKVKSES